MNKLICLLVLVTGITAAAFAQNNTGNTFDIPENHAKRRFTINLGQGNKMQVELSNMEDLDRFLNMDSVISSFLKHLEPLKDSLGDEVMSRRIDYTTDTMGRTMIRIRRYDPAGSSFLVDDDNVAALKLQQDTIHITGKVSFIAKYTLRKAFTSHRYYRVSFFLNDISDLSKYMDGTLSEKLRTLRDEISSNWMGTGHDRVYLKAEPSVSARLPKGYINGGDFLNFRGSVDIQNYKHYFVPSFSVGAGVVISNSNFKRDIMLSWDPHFFFAKDSLSQLKTYRNDFLTLTWGQGAIFDNNPRKESHLLFVMSLGYLVHKSGDYFEANTFRIGAGRLSLFGGKTKIEPALYFNNFFKGVSPGLRLIQSF